MKRFIFFGIYTALLSCILASHVYMLLYYWAALLAVALLLHLKPAYKKQSGKLTDFFMLLFVAFIVWERTRHYTFNSTIELVINDAEHILFALLICSIISFLLGPRNVQVAYALQKLFVTIFMFNTIGLMNEFFQNTISGRPVYLLIPDSQKDILMNLCGSTLFVAICILRIKNLRDGNRFIHTA